MLVIRQHTCPCYYDIDWLGSTGNGANMGDDDDDEDGDADEDAKEARQQKRKVS